MVRLVFGLALCGLLTSSAAAQDRPQCAHDDSLARAAAELVLDARPLSPDTLLRLARRQGSQAPTVHALRVRDGSSPRVGQWLSELNDRVDAPLSCGEARSERGTLLLAAPTGGRVEWSGDSRVSVSLADGLSDPALVVRGADGSLHHLPVRSSRVDLPVELSLPATVQLVASGRAGPRPVAELVLAREGDPEPRPVVGGDDLRDRVAELRHRRNGGARLRDNRLLEEAAEAHAQTVCRTGRVAHRDDDGTDPERRLRDRGIEARVVGEVVARGLSQAAAMDALVRSPSHQLALTDRRFTDLGLGTASDDRGRACVVVVLAAWPRYFGR